MKDLIEQTKQIGTGQIATVVGRYFIMDRDKRWERVEVGLNGLVVGDGEESSDPVKTIQERYEKGETDEFLKPIIVGGKDGRIQGMIVVQSMCNVIRAYSEFRKRHRLLLQLSL